MPKFTISVLALNNLDLTKRCVESVLSNSQDYELILTNNGSTDGTKIFFDELAREFPQIRVTHNPENLGFQEPNRIALDEAKGTHLVLLNNDCVVPQNWLTELEKPFAQFPTACITAPKACASALRPDFNGYRSTKAFEYCEFSTAMLKVELFRKHGLWIPGIKHSYADDSSTCLRMRELGYSLHLVPINVLHHGGRTGKFVPNIRKIQEDNHTVCRRRFAHYLAHRKFDYPILLKRAAAWGDVLLVTPIIRALRKEAPLSPIYVETGCEEIFRGNPHIVKAEKKVARRADMKIINLDGSYEATPGRHIVASYAERAGVTVESLHTDIYPTPADVAAAERLVPEGDWVAIHAGPSTWKGKDWPTDRFVAVANALREAGSKVVLVGAPARAIPNDADTRGRTSAQGTTEIIRRCRLFIGVDSFPFHLAESVGTPAIGLFGVTDPAFISTRPGLSTCLCGTTPSFGLRHRVVNQTSVDDGGAAMNSITVEMVLEAVAKRAQVRQIILA